jgi:hypothetical protein
MFQRPIPALKIRDSHEITTSNQKLGVDVHGKACETGFRLFSREKESKPLHVFHGLLTFSYKGGVNRIANNIPQVALASQDYPTRRL